MPQAGLESYERLSLRIRPSEKAIIMRAASMKQKNVTSFVLRAALHEAKAIIEQAERIELSERDTLRVLELLEQPPAPNAKLRATARKLPDLQ